MALLVFLRYHCRLHHAAQESIDELTETTQVLARTDQFRIRWTDAAVEVCPIGRDQRLAPVR
jgi:hypothetical protein